MKTVMRDTTVNLKSLQSRLHEVLLFNRVFNPCLMTKGHRYAKENNEESLVFTTEVWNLLKLSGDKRRNKLEIV